MKKLRWVMIILILAIGVGGAAIWLSQDPHVAKGRKVYLQYCASCHGLKGRGDGFNTTRLDPPPRDLTDRIEPYMAEVRHEDIFTAISSGVAGIAPVEEEGGQKHVHVHKHGDESKTETGNEGGEEESQGSPLMPYYGFTLSEEEIWSLVVYIRTLHDFEGEPVTIPENVKKERPRLQATKPDEYDALIKKVAFKNDQLILKGREAYEKYGCNGCHWIEPEGGEVGPVLEHVGFMLQPQYIYRWITNPQSLQKDTKMPNLRIPEEEALAITVYLSSLREAPQHPDEERP